MWDATISLTIMHALPLVHEVIVGGGVGTMREAERCS